MTMRFSAQSTYQFDIDEKLAMGMDEVYASPFDPRTNDRFSSVETIIENLEKLREKAGRASERGLAVFPLFLTIMHPEGNFDVHPRFRRQRNLDGSVRPGFVCFRDERRQEEQLRIVDAAAALGFRRIAFDDDFRDAFCYCDEHLASFEGFRGKSREEIRKIFDGALDSAEHEDLRVAWYKSKREHMLYFAQKIETTIHSRNPKCRIGIFTSAKRCQDLSGRRMLEWVDLFHGEEAPAFTRLFGESYFDTNVGMLKSVGWHAYTHAVYPLDVERRLEVTTVPCFEFRSPGNVMFECQAALLACGVPRVHWALAIDFDASALDRHLEKFKKETGALLEKAAIPDRPSADVAVYIGHLLGPYMPVSDDLIRDPMELYANLAFLGFPVTCTDRFDKKLRAAFVSGPMTREMIQGLDEFVVNGGVAVLDALSARAYSLYGGNMKLTVNGPVTGHSGENCPDGTQDNLAGDLQPEAIYVFEGIEPEMEWRGYKANGAETGTTSAIVRYGQGSLILLGYDMGLASRRMTRPVWRRRVLAMLEHVGVSMPVRWEGDPAVQVQKTGAGYALVNHNPCEAIGVFYRDGEEHAVTLASREIKLI